MWAYSRPGKQSCGFSYTKLLNFLILFLILGIMSSVGIPAALMSNSGMNDTDMDPYTRKHVHVQKQLAGPSKPGPIKKMGIRHGYRSEPESVSGVTRTVSLGNHGSALKSAR